MKAIPSKTFLFGEYVAMYGGPALVALTEPLFSKDQQKRLHPDCLAAQFWRRQTGQECTWGLNDPYHKKGGLGASSAEFLLAYRHFFDEQQIGLEHLHQSYIACVAKDAGRPPSGYDLLAQTGFGCSLVESRPFKVSSFDWHFLDLGFVLIHTNKKLATHEHLKNVGVDLDWRRLMNSCEMGCDAYLNRDSEQWIKATHHFYQALLNQNLVTPYTQHLIAECQKDMPILAAKGCGALGADVIVLYVLKEQRLNVCEQLNQRNLEILATDAHLHIKSQEN
jgi:mevalonate kinase